MAPASTRRPSWLKGYRPQDPLVDWVHQATAAPDAGRGSLLETAFWNEPQADESPGVRRVAAPADPQDVKPAAPPPAWSGAQLAAPDVKPMRY